MFKFVLIEPPKLESQGDGRRLALEVIRHIRDDGKLKCSAHPEEQTAQQCGALLAALVQLEQDGTQAAVKGFSAVLSDLLGRALHQTLVPELFEERERAGEFMRWRGEPHQGETSALPEGRSAPESAEPAKARTP